MATIWACFSFYPSLFSSFFSLLLLLSSRWYSRLCLHECVCVSEYVCEYGSMCVCVCVFVSIFNHANENLIYIVYESECIHIVYESECIHVCVCLDRVRVWRSVCVCVCVCVCPQNQSNNECVCVCVCVCAQNQSNDKCVCVCEWGCRGVNLYSKSARAHVRTT